MSLLTAVFLLLLFSCTARRSSTGFTYPTESASSEMSDKPQSTLEGSFIKRAFVSKKGIVSDSIFDLYLSTGQKEYFIKFCESEVPRSEVLENLGKNVKATVELRGGNWDICEGSPPMASRGGEYISLLSFTAPDNPSLRYSDGSGNTYVLTPQNIRYIPVKPAYSSSGMYDGGEPAEKKISAEQYKSMEEAFERIHSAASLHTRERAKGTGMLTHIQDKKEWTVIIPAGAEKDQLEKELKELIK